MRLRAAVEPDRWLPLIPDVAASVPAAAGVFEVATLVRHVLFVGLGDGDLRSRLAELARHPGERLPPSVGGHYFRYRLTDAESAAADALIAAYRHDHAGRLPAVNGARLTQRAA